MDPRCTTRSQSKTKLVSSTSSQDDNMSHVVMDKTPTKVKDDALDGIKAKVMKAVSHSASRLLNREQKKKLKKKNSMESNDDDDEDEESEDERQSEDEAEEEAQDENEKDDLVVEVDDLVEDEAYVSFTQDIVSGKKIPATDPDVDQDPEYVPPPTESDEIFEDGAEGTEDVQSSDAASDEEDIDEGDEIDPNAVPQPDVAIPVIALKEASQRFPPFWRLKRQLANTDADASSYKSEDDPTFAPTEAELSDGATPDASDNEDDSEEEEIEIGEEETSVLAAKVDEDLSQVMEDLTVLNIANEKEEEDVAEEEEEQQQQETICLVEAIESFDATGYDSSTDPDFDPAKVEERAEEEEVDQMDSDSHDEGMEQ